jgi:hypothetical protein
MRVKPRQGGDIFVDVFEAGLAVSITSPVQNGIVPKDVSVNLSAASTVDADLKLWLEQSITATNNRKNHKCKLYFYRRRFLLA